MRSGKKGERRAGEEELSQADPPVMPKAHILLSVTTCPPTKSSAATTATAGCASAASCGCLSSAFKYLFARLTLSSLLQPGEGETSAQGIPERAEREDGRGEEVTPDLGRPDRPSDRLGPVFYPVTVNLALSRWKWK